MMTTTTPTPDPLALNRNGARLLRAALVILKTPTISLWLEQHDPKALAQLEAAVAPYVTQGEPEPAPAVTYGTWTPITELAIPVRPARPKADKRQASAPARKASAPAASPDREPKACTQCGTRTAFTEDWTLWPWPDGAWLCTPCNEARHEREEYPG